MSSQSSLPSSIMIKKPDKTSNKFKIIRNYIYIIIKKAAWQSEFSKLAWYGDRYGVCQQYWAITNVSSFLTSNLTYKTGSIWSHFSSPKHLQCTASFQAEQKKVANECACRSIGHCLKKETRKKMSWFLWQ